MSMPMKPLSPIARMLMKALETRLKERALRLAIGEWRDLDFSRWLPDGSGEQGSKRVIENEPREGRDGSVTLETTGGRQGEARWDDGGVPRVRPFDLVAPDWRSGTLLPGS